MKRISSLMQISLIVLTLIALIGVDACPQKNATTTGFGGLSLNFVDDAPPLNVIINQKFPIYADVVNLGEANVNPATAKFYLLGVGKNIENVQTSLSNKNFLDKDASERISFADSAVSTLELSSPFTAALFLASCYKYGGKAQADICIAGSNASKVCSISGDKAASNTAEPLQVSALTEELVGGKLQISFTIVNKGKGEVYLPGSDCDKLILPEKKDINEALKNGKVQISVRTKEDLKCKLQSLAAPYSSVDSLEGSTTLGKVTCEKNVIGESDHKAPVQIVLDYVYVESSSQNIIITPN